MSLLSITGLAAIVPFSEKLAEPPAGTVTGLVNVNVVFALGGVTVTDCPAPLTVIELNRPGRLALIVTDEMVSAAGTSLVMVNVPAVTLVPGAATSATDRLRTSAPAAGFGVGPGLGVDVGLGVGFVVGAGVAPLVAVAVAVWVGVAKLANLQAPRPSVPAISVPKAGANPSV
jgi:hypothetical protein